MICIASYTLNFLHPGYLLAEVIEEQREQKKNTKVSKSKKHGKRGSDVRESMVPLREGEMWDDGAETTVRGSIETEKFLQHA